MSKMRKLATSGVALAMTAVLALTGTFAWQNISQQALNEKTATINPGARLHDDFNGSIKRVYVENFASAADGTDIFARVRLDEYMEIGTGAGKKNDTNDGPADDNKATTLVAEGELADRSTWTTRKPTDTEDTNAFLKYWDWDKGGKTTYMPTFNKDKDSLEADINGTLAGTGSGTAYDDFVNWETETTKEKTTDAYYDADTDDTPDSHETPDPAHVTVVQETHTARETLNGRVMTMVEFKDAAGNNSQPGDFWVWDNDGWFYWANPIHPDSATGLLLNGIRLKLGMSDTWYYGINVVAQFATADDLGWNDQTGNRKGFYNTNAAGDPDITEDAEKLLAAIGAVPQPEADSVEMTMADGPLMVKGTAWTRQFSAEVKLGGKVAANQDVVWTVSGNMDTTGTKISNTGLLTVSAAEKADVLTVTATHKDYSLGNLAAVKTIQLFDSTADAINYLQPGSADTVLIDNTELHVLAKDAENDRVLLLTKQVVGTATYSGTSLGSATNVSVAMASWLNGKSTLNKVSVETDVIYLTLYGDSTKVTGKAFPLSVSDMFGTPGGTSVTGYAYYNYTYNSAKLPAPGGSWVAYDTSGVAAAYFSRERGTTSQKTGATGNGRTYTSTTNIVSTTGQRSNIIYNGNYSATSGYRPAMWVDLTKLG